MVSIEKKNEIYLRVGAEMHIHHELSEYFCFEVPEAKYLQKRKRYRRWDGKIRLYSPGTGELYVGLYPYLIEWLQKMGYDYKIEDSEYGDPDEFDANISQETVKSFVRSLGLPFKARDYQLAAIYSALRNHRRLLLSPTGSGKSLIIYVLVRWYLKREKQILIVVPSISLVEQLYKDFKTYRWYSKQVGKIYGGMGGRDQWQEYPVIISTWQSIYKEDPQFFKRFDVIIGDEAHQYKSKSLTGILNKCYDAKYRFGLTGTLDGLQCHQLMLEGMFGSVERTVRTSELQKDGYLSDLKINILLCRHDTIFFEDYQEEINKIIENRRRNKIICKLSLDIANNTLILFNFVEKHGEPLWELLNSINKLKQTDTQKQLFFIHGGVAAEEREKVRELCEHNSNAIILASYGTFSTGINIKNLHNIIFASPMKSRVRNLQSIGRALRTHDSKAQATLYDFADDFSNEHYRNITLNHLKERIKIYKQERFNYSITEIKLGDTDG